jgi:excisionase family DNA binding protein
MPTPPHIYSFLEAIEYLRCSRRHLERLVHEQRIGSYKSGRNRTFAQAHLDAYLRSCEVGHEPEAQNAGTDCESNDPSSLHSGDEVDRVPDPTSGRERLAGSGTHRRRVPVAS